MHIKYDHRILSVAPKKEADNFCERTLKRFQAQYYLNDLSVIYVNNIFLIIPYISLIIETVFFFAKFLIDSVHQHHRTF